MPHSHHSHSGQFCRHAKDSLEDVIKEAIAQGFEVFGLSEHGPRWRVEDLFPEEADLTPSDLLSAYESFLSAAVALRDAYSSRISLLIGLETDWITPLDSAGLSRVLAAHPEIDYLVGSVHHVCGVSIDFDRDTWLRAVWTAGRGAVGTTMVSTPDGPSLVKPDVGAPQLRSGYVPTVSELRPFLLDYFDAQYDLLQQHQPEIIGHLDLCLLWTPEVSLRGEKMADVWETVERNVRFAVGYGALFEANAAAIRKGWATSYPSRDILDLILSLGGRICFSDDSHGVSYVGLNYSKMRRYLAHAGVKELWYLVRAAERQEGDEVIGNRHRVVARRTAGNWQEHSFWAKLADRQAKMGQ